MLSEIIVGAILILVIALVAGIILEVKMNDSRRSRKRNDDPS